MDYLYPAPATAAPGGASAPPLVITIDDSTEFPSTVSRWWREFPEDPYAMMSCALLEVEVPEGTPSVTVIDTSTQDNVARQSVWTLTPLIVKLPGYSGPVAVRRTMANYQLHLAVWTGVEATDSEDWAGSAQHDGLTHYLVDADSVQLSLTDGLVYRVAGVGRRVAVVVDSMQHMRVGSSPDLALASYCPASSQRLCVSLDGEVDALWTNQLGTGAVAHSLTLEVHSKVDDEILGRVHYSCNPASPHRYNTSLSSGFSYGDTEEVDGRQYLPLPPDAWLVLEWNAGDMPEFLALGLPLLALRHAS